MCVYVRVCFLFLPSPYLISVLTLGRLLPALADTFIPQSDPPVPPNLGYQPLTDGEL